MPKKIFIELESNKKNSITDVMLNEFANYPYNDCSTNRIVKNAGISKGSLFKYFGSKEDMYFYIVDHVVAALTNDIKDALTNLPQDIFKRTIRFAEIEFDWHLKNPIKYKLFKKAFDKSDSEIYKKTEARYLAQGEEFYYKLFDTVDFSEYKTPKDKLLNIIKWFLEGFNKEFMDSVQPKNNIDQTKNKYITELTEYINILRMGLE